jgi:hypothetical protein
MTDGDIVTLRPRPPDSPPPGGEWLPLPGAGYYEASHRGKVRSVDRTKNGRAYLGVVLKLREDGDGYLVFNYTDDAGVRHHNVSVARTVLLAHDPGGYREGLQACHGPGGQRDNRWPENLRWDTSDANREEALAARLANTPPKVRPPKACPRCAREHQGKGRNCPDCVDGLARASARLLAAGTMLDKVAGELEYPPAACYNLAVRRGYLRVTLSEAHPDYVPSPPPRLRRVLFWRDGPRRTSDAR